MCCGSKQITNIHIDAKPKFWNCVGFGFASSAMPGFFGIGLGMSCWNISGGMFGGGLYGGFGGSIFNPVCYSSGYTLGNYTANKIAGIFGK